MAMLPFTSEETGIMATPGHQFFDAHMAYIYANDIDGMIDNQYSEDAVLISPFDILDTPPPHIVRGRAP